MNGQIKPVENDKKVNTGTNNPTYKFYNQLKKQKSQ